MHEHLYELKKQSYFYDVPNDSSIFDYEKFVKIVLQDCKANLDFHGHEDAISQLRWHAQSKYGIILD
jgi:hypothetical protein